MPVSNPVSVADDIQTIPVLASLNFDETVAFYAGQLGFQLHGRFDDYLLLRLGALELHFWLTKDRAICEMTSCYIRGGGVPGLFKYFMTKDMSGGRISAFSVRPWNMKEFYIWDSHGNLIKFGCAPEEVQE